MANYKEDSQFVKDIKKLIQDNRLIFDRVDSEELTHQEGAMLSNELWIKYINSMRYSSEEKFKDEFEGFSSSEKTQPFNTD